MPRRKLSEFRAKELFSSALTLPYDGWHVESSNIDAGLAKVPKAKQTFVVKVDQAIKGRFKKGLVLLNIPYAELGKAVKQLHDKGYDHFIVEPYKKHEAADERYVALMHDRKGLWLSYSKQGGVDIEASPDSIKKVAIDTATKWTTVAKATGFTVEQLKILVATYRKNHCTFLEINPYIVTNNGIDLLDLAVEVDDAGLSFGTEWSMGDVREIKKALTPEELVVRALDKGSMASFSLSVINPEGAIFLLLSGGGASVVIADEVFNQGLGKQLANYGEYSGNPSTHEAEKYTSEVLKLLLASPAPKKVLFIGGAVANFTDIANTFGGVIAAFDAVASELQKHDVTVYVRRGGPRQEIGLARIREALDRLGIMGGVYDPSTSISEALTTALGELR